MFGMNFNTENVHYTTDAECLRVVNKWQEHSMILIIQEFWIFLKLIT
jgi:hypothetical protein